MEHPAQQIQIMSLQMLAEIMGRNTHIEFPLNLNKSDGADVSEPSVKGLRLYVVTYQLKTLVPSGIYNLLGFHSFWLRGIDF